MAENKGVIQPELKTTDFVAGAETGITYQEVNPTGNWADFLPSIEKQKFAKFDTMACVSFSALNCIEIQLNHMLANNKIPQDKVKKLQDWGYIEDGKFNFSDRFTAKMSGTTPQGNTLQNVWDSIRKDGLVPEDMWPSAKASWAEYYKEIPQQVKDFGKNILTMLEFKYEWVMTFHCGLPYIEMMKYHLKQAPLQPAHPVCSPDASGVYQPCGSCTPQHATTIYNIDNLVHNFDHYDPYNKNHSHAYTFPWIMKGVALLKQEQPEEPPFNHVFNVDMKYGQSSHEIKQLQKAYNVLGYKMPVTGYYGEITRTNTLDFWKKYNIATWWEINHLKGKVVGPKTRAKLNELLGVNN